MCGGDNPQLLISSEHLHLDVDGKGTGMSSQEFPNPFASETWLGG